MRAGLTWQVVRREPYRLLFPLGIVFGCLGVSHWLFYAWGASDVSSHYHASIQLGAYVYCFIAGFLWTAIPRMTATAPTSPYELWLALGLLAAQALLLIMRHAVLAQCCFIGLLLLLVAFVGRRLMTRRTPAQGPTEFVWIPIGIGFGVIGSGLLVAGAMGAVPAWVAVSGRVMAQQGFVLSLVVGVAGFMAPRLMGRATPIVDTGLTVDQVNHVRRRRLMEHALGAVFLGASCVLEGGGFIRAAYAMRAAVVTFEWGRRVRWWEPPAGKELSLRLLWISLWCVIVGLWAVAGWPRFRVALLHLMLIGGFSVMMFAVGTMVVLSHAGEPDMMRKPLWVLRMVGVGLAAATLARGASDLWPAHFFAWLATAALCWLTTGLAWLLFIMPWVVRVPSEGAFERAHEHAKQRLLREQTTPSC